MRFLKLILISVLVLFGVVTFIGLLLPNKIVVSRATDIIAPKDSILKITSSIYEWKKWVTGMEKQGNEIISATEANFNGTKVLINSVNDYEIHSLWTGKKGSTQESILRIIQNSTSTKAVVQWQFTEHLKWYPWQRFGSMMNETMIGSLLETNLANLKKLMENHP